MRRIVTLLLFVVTSLAMCQPVTRMWIKTTSYPGSDSYQDIGFDNLGNTYVCGTSIFAATGKNAFLIVKFDRNGNKIWEKVLPGVSGHSVAQRLAVDSGGNVVVVGTTQFNPPADGQSRIVRVSPGGTVLSDVAGSAATGSAWYSVAVNSLGEATATGYVNGGGGKVMRTSHFLTSGTLAWSRDYSYPGIPTTVDQHGVEVLVDSADNIYVCGVHNSSPNGCWNTIVKYNRSASQLWMTHVKNGFVDYPRGFVMANENLLVMACEVTLNGFNYVYENFFDKNGVKQSRVEKFDYHSFRPSIKSLAADDLGTTYYAATRHDPNSQIADQSFGISKLGLTAIQFVGFSEPDIRALCIGPGKNDLYIGSSVAGSGARPLTILAQHIQPFHGRPDVQHVWMEKIFGSTANGQIPYAIASRMKSNSIGDIFAIGTFSGANAADAFIVKYELGPLAMDDYGFAFMGDTISDTTGVLINDAQHWDSTLALIQPPLYGDLTLNADGTYTYVPDAGFAGRDRAVYRLTRNASQVRTSDGTIEFNVVPDAVGVSASPSTLKGGGLVNITATVSARVNYNLECGIWSDSQNLHLPNSIFILKDRSYGTLRVGTSPVTSTVNVNTTFSCGRTQKTTVVTLTP